MRCPPAERLRCALGRATPACVSKSPTPGRDWRRRSARGFSPYYTSKHHGTGLGLAIVQSVVSDHGGTISVSSDAGRGTTFRIDLPHRPPNRPAAPKKETPAPPPQVRASTAG